MLLAGPRQLLGWGTPCHRGTGGPHQLLPPCCPGTLGTQEKSSVQLHAPRGHSPRQQAEQCAAETHQDAPLSPHQPECIPAAMAALGGSVSVECVCGVCLCFCRRGGCGWLVHNKGKQEPKPLELVLEPALGSLLQEASPDLPFPSPSWVSPLPVAAGPTPSPRPYQELLEAGRASHIIQVPSPSTQLCKATPLTPQQLRKGPGRPHCFPWLGVLRTTAKDRLFSVRCSAPMTPLGPEPHGTGRPPRTSSREHQHLPRWTERRRPGFHPPSQAGTHSPFLEMQETHSTSVTQEA